MVHTFYLNGYYIALDVNSGAVHVLDKLCFDLLNKFTDKLPEEFPAGILDELAKEYISWKSINYSIEFYR